jgi:hypothetical protein
VIVRDRHARFVLGCLLLVAVTGCESARSSAPPPRAAYEPVGELTGTWTGTWGGMPVTLLIAEHTEGASYSGLYVGPWLVAGGSYPGISGILTYERSGSQASMRFNGWIHSSRPFVAVLVAEPPDGPLRLRLQGAGPGRLTGEGQSTFRWGPHGPVALAHRDL